MEQRGILMVLSGFSGAGKGTLVKALLKKYNDYALSISMTTRAGLCCIVKSAHFVPFTVLVSQLPK